MKIQISLNLSGTNDVQICVDGRNYLNLITASLNFRVAAVTAATAALVVEQVNLSNTAINALSAAIASPISATRNDAIKVARFAVDSSLTALAKTVETIANASNVLDVNRLAIVHSAGMIEKTYSIRQKQAFAVETGTLEGTVFLYAKGITRGSHEWRYSLDTTNFTNWIPVDSTLQAFTMVSDLESGRQYAFGHRTILKDGPTPWEGPLLGRAK